MVTCNFIGYFILSAAWLFSGSVSLSFSLLPCLSLLPTTCQEGTFIGKAQMWKPTFKKGGGLWNCFGGGWSSIHLSMKLSPFKHNELFL
jgi:hypothetical protein